MWKNYTWLAVALLLAAEPPGARADFATSLLELGNQSFPGVTSPYAELDITGDTTTGTLTFQLKNTSNNSSATVFFSELAFNMVTGSSSDFTVTAPSSWSVLNSNNSTFGSFDVWVGKSSDHESPPVTITLQFNSGKFSEASVANLEATSTGSNGGNYFAAHYLVGADGKDQVTGFIAGDSITHDPVVPAPPGLALAMLGCGVLGLFYLARRRKVIAPT